MLKINWYIINFVIEWLNVSCIELIVYFNNLDRILFDFNVNWMWFLNGFDKYILFGIYVKVLWCIYNWMVVL